jgi:protocatechuate 3,4-dioxygenase, beta subunit
MKRQSINFIMLLLVMLSACTDSKTSAQTSVSGARAGGRCEGCEAIYENTVPLDKLGWELNLPGYNDQGPKLEITGTVYKKDGKTPAGNVILYFYHTDQAGIYPTKGDETGWGKRHGYIRGWLKTNEKGQYKLNTLRPASYPSTTIEAHIHCIIKEENVNEYYIHDFLFEDDPYLSEQSRNRSNQPGGNGVLTVKKENGKLVAKRDIFLGRNVSNYPKN